MRADGRVIGQGVLVVSDVRDDGMREILGVEVADTESEATYQDLFRSLKVRGLSGVVLVISNEHEGLKAAISRHFQGASQQRFQVHYTVGTSSAWCGQPKVEHTRSANSHSLRPLHECYASEGAIGLHTLGHLC